MRIFVSTVVSSDHFNPLLLAWQRLGAEVLVVFDRAASRFGDMSEVSWGDVDAGLLERDWFRRLYVGKGSGNRTRLSQLLGEYDCVILGGYSSAGSRAILRIPRDHRPPTVVIAERPDHRKSMFRTAVRNLYLRWVIRRVDAVWAMSERGRREYERLGAEVPTYSPYPVPEPSRPISRSREGGDSQDIVIVIVGRLDARKDPLAAAAALDVLHQRGVRFAAYFCGAGPLEDVLAAAVEHLPVQLLGHVAPERLRKILSGADVMLHPCRYDGWGMVVPEAVAAGVAVVAGEHTDAAVELSRVSDTVRISPTDPESLADAIQSLAALVLSEDGAAALRATQESALQLAGVDQVAERTLDDLRKRVGP